MKVTSVTLLKHNGENTDPFLLGNAVELSSFGFFQRGTVKEMLVFVSRTICKRTANGVRQSVAHEEYMGHVYNKNGVVAIIFCDKEYPARSAFCIVNKVLDDYVGKMGDAWTGVSADSTDGDAVCQEAIEKYQDPAQADKLLAIQRELDETKVILHNTIDSVLQRGEKLDSLVEKSSDLSMASQMFYKQARKQNACCGFM
ncbi:VAMP-like protein ykt61 [Pycnococcus provasolii]|uniref:VAMP-like protein ykt61 n=2 Tax=Pycnococcus provasolii TaxID=41880 RepID=A0A830HEC6_9CHLO|nr:VAMP-like protein ykt61 [Pycnococcus provasolii]